MLRGTKSTTSRWFFRTVCGTRAHPFRSSLPRTALLVLCSVLVSTVSVRARGTPPAETTAHPHPAAPRDPENGLNLEWEAPDTCSVRNRTVEKVGRLLGGPPERIVPALHARAQVGQNPSGTLRLVLVLSSQTGERSRELEATSCVELSDAAALILALAINPDLDRFEPATSATLSPEHRNADSRLADGDVLTLPSAPSEVRSATELRPNLPPVASASIAAVPVSAATTRSLAAPWHLSLELGPTLTLGTVPSPAFGVAAGVALITGRLRVALLGTMVPAHRIIAADRPSAGGELGFLSGTARTCYLVGGRRAFEFSGCWVFEAGLISGHGFGVGQPLTVSEPWLWGGLGGLARIEVMHPLALVLETAGMVGLRKLDFRVAGIEVQQSSAVGGILRLLLELRIF